MTINTNERYRICRFYAQNGGANNRIIKTGLTLAEAQAHCKDPEMSSGTCQGDAGKDHTHRYGAWFDGYEKDPG